MFNLPAFCKNMFLLLIREDLQMKTNFGLPIGQCQKCKTRIKHPNEIVYEVDTKDMMNRDVVSLKHILNLLISNETRKDCCFKSFRFEDAEEKITILECSHPVNILIPKIESIGGTQVVYKSHFDERDGVEVSTYFQREEKIMK